MTEERYVTVEGIPRTVVISDDQEALAAAKAAGRAIVGLWDKKRPDKSMKPAVYLVESLSDLDEEYLERVARRGLCLPWTIARTERLIIREFTVEDAASVPENEMSSEQGESDSIFYTPSKLRAYINNQYGFFQCGIWAVTDIGTGRIVGKAGVTPLDGDLELGYHIFAPFRGRGLATEACRATLRYASENFDAEIYLRTSPANRPSVCLAHRLGFRLIHEGGIGSDDLSVYLWSGAEESNLDC